MNEDLIALRLSVKLSRRAATGLLKYGTSLSDANLSRAQLLTHLQEELLDAASYIEQLLTLEETKPLGFTQTTQHTFGA